MASSSNAGGTTTMNSSSSSCVHTVTSSSSSSDAAEPACILDVLLPDTIIQILKLLRHTPACIASFSLSCSQAYALCSDAALWAGLCRALTHALPSAFTGVDWSPAAWGVGSHRELYACLLQPYAPLLQQRVWHTAKMPPGQLLVIDAMPPLIVARSVSYKNLQAGPFSHGVFVVRLPQQLSSAAPPPKAKARVYCCACPPSERLSAEDKLSCSMARSGKYYGMLHARHLAPAQLSFLQACQVDAAAAAEDASSAAATPQQTAAPNALGSNSSRSSSSSSGGGGVPADAARDVAGLALRCTAACGGLCAELVNRWQIAEPHSTTIPGSEPAAAAPAGSQQPAADAPGISNSNSDSSGSGSSDGSSDLPLPDVGEFGISPWDLRWIVEELELPADWRSHAVYRPFHPTPWLLPAAAAAVSGSGDAAPVGSDSSGRSDSGSAGRDGCALLAVAAGAAVAGLPGLWRGTYGSHGVELVQLQLLPVAAGYNLLQQHGVTEGPILRVGDCPRGVLLASVLHTAPPVLHPSLRVPGRLPASDGPAAAPQQQQQQQPQSEAAGTVGPTPCDTLTSTQQQQQQQQQQSQQQQPHNLLLVGTKVTGDRNVPAGQVTFAVDLASRSTEGAEQPLQLPPGVHSDVRVNAAGTRQLVVKERYSGLAQIADVHFQSPRLIEVQLLVFEGGDCLGLLWRPPMDSFSLLSRLPALP